MQVTRTSIMAEKKRATTGGEWGPRATTATWSKLITDRVPVWPTFIPFLSTRDAVILITQVLSGKQTRPDLAAYLFRFMEGIYDEPSVSSGFASAALQRILTNVNPMIFKRLRLQHREISPTTFAPLIFGQTLKHLTDLELINCGFPEEDSKEPLEVAVFTSLIAHQQKALRKLVLDVADSPLQPCLLGLATYMKFNQRLTTISIYSTPVQLDETNVLPQLLEAIQVSTKLVVLELPFDGTSDTLERLGQAVKSPLVQLGLWPAQKQRHETYGSWHGKNIVALFAAIPTLDRLELPMFQPETDEEPAKARWTDMTTKTPSFAVVSGHIASAENQSWEAWKAFPDKHHWGKVHLLTKSLAHFPWYSLRRDDKHMDELTISCLDAAPALQFPSGTAKASSFWHSLGHHMRRVTLEQKGSEGDWMRISYDHHALAFSGTQLSSDEAIRVLGETNWTAETLHLVLRAPFPGIVEWMENERYLVTRKELSIRYKAPTASTNSSQDAQVIGVKTLQQWLSQTDKLRRLDLGGDVACLSSDALLLSKWPATLVHLDVTVASPSIASATVLSLRNMQTLVIGTRHVDGNSGDTSFDRTALMRLTERNPDLHHLGLFLRISGLRSSTTTAASWVAPLLKCRTLTLTCMTPYLHVNELQATMVKCPALEIVRFGVWADEKAALPPGTARPNTPPKWSPPSVSCFAAQDAKQLAWLDVLVQSTPATDLATRMDTGDKLVVHKSATTTARGWPLFVRHHLTPSPSHVEHLRNALSYEERRMVDEFML